MLHSQYQIDAGGLEPRLSSLGSCSDVLPRAVAAPAGHKELIRRAVSTDQEGNGRALGALADVSRQLEASRDLPDFFGRMSRSVAALLPCGRAAFWLLDPDDGCLRVQPETLGIPFGSHLAVSCTADGPGMAERVVHDDWTLLGEIPRGGPDGVDPLVDLLRRFGDGSTLFVPWRAGDRHLGAVSAFDSRSPGGFTEEDAHLLRLIGLGAGLAWDRRRTEETVRRRRDHEAAGLRAETDRVTSLEHVKSDFLKLASHELRAPVAVLRGYLSMISDGSFGDLKNPRLMHLLPILEGKVEEIDRLVAEMLETARLDDERHYLRLDDFDLCGLVRRVVRATDVKRDGRHPLALLIGKSPAPVRADRERVEMIVSNLVDNAIKYSPEGGDIDVECRAETAQGLVQVVVSDQGLGIAAAEMPRLFTRFGRIVTPENAHIPGTGLGLYLARELARLHGGDLTAISVGGHGSAFTLTLPLADRD